VVGGKIAGLGTKEYKLMLDPKEGKIRTCILIIGNLEKLRMNMQVGL